MTKNIPQIVADALIDQPRQFLQEVVDHGIHNLTNDFQGDDQDEYDAFTSKFEQQAQAALDALDAFSDSAL